MFRRFLPLALVGWLCHSCCVYAQTLIVPPESPAGAAIVARIEGLPEGARVAWKSSAGSAVVNVGKGRAHLWASGAHTVSAVVALADPAGTAQEFAAVQIAPRLELWIATLAAVRDDLKGTA